MDRYRWTDAHGVVRPAPPLKREQDDREQHVHIHLPENLYNQPHVAARDRRPHETRGRDQREDPSEQPDCGPLLARVRQDGKSGEWSGNLADDGGDNGEGTPLVVKTDPEGGLLLHHSLREEGTGDADPAGLGIKRLLDSASHDAIDDAAFQRVQARGFASDPAEAYASQRSFTRRMAEAFKVRR